MNISSFLFPCDDYCPDWATTYLSHYSPINIIDESEKEKTPVKSRKRTINFKIV